MSLLEGVELNNWLNLTVFFSHISKFDSLITKQSDGDGIKNTGRKAKPTIGS